MDRTVVSRTGTTVRRRNAGRTRKTSGKSIFTGAARARSATAARRDLRTSAASSRVASVERRPERLRTGQDGHRATQVGEREPLGHRRELRLANGHRDPRHRDDARSSAPSGPRSTDTDRCRPATADSPAADPAASRSSSCGISASIARRRRAPRRGWLRAGGSETPSRRPAEPSAASVPGDHRARWRRRAPGVPRVHVPDHRRRTPGARAWPRATPATAHPAATAASDCRDDRLRHRTSRRCRIHRNATAPARGRRPAPSLRAASRSHSSISRRDVSRRNAKNPIGSMPRITPERRAWAVSARTSRCAARRSRSVPASPSSTVGQVAAAPTMEIQHPHDQTARPRCRCASAHPVERLADRRSRLDRVDEARELASGAAPRPRLARRRTLAAARAPPGVRRRRAPTASAICSAAR